ncbi:hypothetical protein MJM45_19910, partial [Salmonella enterica subsp. enterica serovar Kentucky]|nr:hypothetical protein [Salmonella enterica subsp. enterica serovar Kentucky]
MKCIINFAHGFCYACAPNKRIRVIMQSWYLLYCKRGQLQRAQEHLERQAVSCLTPMITLEK